MLSNEVLDIYGRARELKKNPAILFLDAGHDIREPKLWADPDHEESVINNAARGVDLTVCSDANKDVIGRFAHEISAAVKFPLASTYLTALGVVSSAMVERFFVRYNDGEENTVGLYIVVAQPPSTGKSGVISLLCKPMHHAYKDKAEAKEPMRNALERKIARLKRAIAKEKNESTLDSMDLELIELLRKLNDIPLYNWAVNDATAEGCEKILSKQGGFFNMISDESSAVKVLMGMVYGDKAVNNGIFLKAWDNGFHSVARQSRDGFNGHVRGSFIVLAQDVSINAIIKVGEEGEGISERVLTLEESNLLGRRVHEKRQPISREIKSNYADFCRWIIGEPSESMQKVVLDLDEGAEDYVLMIRNKFEHLMADGARYSSNMLRGFVGKADKQIIKLAAVLRAARSYEERERIDTPISFFEIERAESIFNVLLAEILKITESRGLTGYFAEISEAKKLCIEIVGKNKKIGLSVQLFRESLRGRKAFRGSGGLAKKLDDEIFPMLEALNFLVVDRKTKWVHLNPRLGI